MLDSTWLSLPLAAGEAAFTSTNALSTLLTVESFLFAVINVAIGASALTPMGNRVLQRPRRFAFWAASLLTVVAAGAAVAWWDLFVDGEWPDRFGGWGPVVVIAAAILAQPTLTWWLARGMPGPRKRS